MNIGAEYRGRGQCDFTVWAPTASQVTVQIVSPGKRLIPMAREEGGYWKTQAKKLAPGHHYLYRLNNTTDRPDPASHFQPLGVHGPSEIIDHNSFTWHARRMADRPLSEWIIYELHVGTFTPEGTFDAIIPRLADLKQLGVTAVELMPVAQFPGERNWGYDGVYPYAVQASYGGPEGLKRLVDACHGHDLSVVLDVVYNHLGPEGNYLREFGPYFTEKYSTPWGTAVNVDDAYCDGLRNYFIENAFHWFEHYRVDALRLDAIHAIFDMSARPFLQELADRTGAYNKTRKRRHYLIAESDLNDTRIIRPREQGGFGLDAQWSDDFHHALHTLVTGEHGGYYADFGRVADLAKALSDGYVIDGGYSAYRKRHHGNSSVDRPADQFVVCAQNHDQVGNRLNGERLSQLVSFEALKLSAAVLLLSPYVPLLFMGEEYGEEAPFLYFVSHSDEALIEAVRRGRAAEFRAFGWQHEPPDPQSVEVFNRSKLSWNQRTEGTHGVLLNFYEALSRLRRETPALSHPDKQHLEVRSDEARRLVTLHRWQGNAHIQCYFNFNKSEINFAGRRPRSSWTRLIDSSDPEWNGPGTLLPARMRGQSVVVYTWREHPAAHPASTRRAKQRTSPTHKRRRAR